MKGKKLSTSVVIKTQKLQSKLALAIAILCIVLVGTLLK